MVSDEIGAHHWLSPHGQRIRMSYMYYQGVLGLFMESLSSNHNPEGPIGMRFSRVFAKLKLDTVGVYILGYQLFPEKINLA
jgi:hypothetical protein